MDLKVWDPGFELSFEAEALESSLHPFRVTHVLTCLLCGLTGSISLTLTGKLGNFFFLIKEPNPRSYPAHSLPVQKKGHLKMRAESRCGSMGY